MAVQHYEIRDVTVHKVNSHGFQTTDGEWVNVSKFADAAECPLPLAGQTVRVSLDGKGFARKIEVVAPPAPASSAPASTSANARDVQIARMNALGHAVQIVTTNAGRSGGKVSLDDVLAAAAQLEGWILR